MARVRALQGTPTHLEVLKSKDSKRRHSAHCKYAVGRGKQRMCDCVKSPRWREHCGSSKHCDCYEEKD